MACCAGCPESKRAPFEPCITCGPYGTICCLKMTAGGGTWYLRKYPNDGGDIAEIYWQPGDDCIPAYVTYEPYEWVSTNLCSQLRSSGPCGNPLPRKWVGWQVLDDCSGVVLRLHYDTGHGIAKFSVTVGTIWISTGLPIVFTTPDTWTGSGEYDGGDVTIEACPAGEPPPPIYKICCMQLSAVGRWGANIKRDRSQADIDYCIEDNSELRISRTGTEQCQDSSGGHYLLDDASGDDVIASGASPTPFGLGLGSYTYSISDDYSTITLSVDYNFNHYSTGFPMTWQEVYFGTYSTTIAFTADWFLTPIEFEIDGIDVSNGDAPVTATLTLSVCGYEVGGNPCWGEKLVCVDLAYESSVSLNGTYGMPWDGDEYASDWTAYNASFEVRVRLRESEDTPGTWETILDVRTISTGAIESDVIGSEVIDCDPAGTVSGGGEGDVDGQGVTVAIHECATECLQQTDQMFFTIDPTATMQYTPGTYAISATGTGYASSWSPPFEGGGGYQFRVRVEWDGVTMCGETFETLAYYGAFIDVYNVTTEETATVLLFNFCVGCNVPYCLGCVPVTTDPFGGADGYPEEVTIFA